MAILTGWNYKRLTLTPAKKVAIITRWPCYWGSHKAGFHCTKEGWRLYKLLKIHSCNHFHPFFLITAWENSRHFTRPQLVSLQNGVWEMRTKIPYWWPFTTQIWAVGLMGWKFASTNQKHYQIWVLTCHQYGISALVSQTSFCDETSDGVAKCHPFVQATF